MDLSGQGYTLNVQELTAINSGLTKLQSNEKYDKIYFWGKIFGNTSDYYIAYGLRDAEFEMEVLVRTKEGRTREGVPNPRRAEGLHPD